MYIEKEVIERVERSLEQFSSAHNDDGVQYNYPNQNNIYELPTIYKDTNVKFSNYSK